MYEIKKLQEHLLKARSELRLVEETLQKVEGKGFSNGPARFLNKLEAGSRLGSVQDSRKSFGSDSRPSLKRGGVRDKRDGPPIKQRAIEKPPKGVFSRLSSWSRPRAPEDDFEEPSSKPAVSSRVIAQNMEVPSRQEVIAAQTSDEISKQRNRRMFGSLLGTLQKFRREETQVKERVEKKLRVEQKLEDDEKREKEKRQIEKRELMLEKRRREADIKRMEWSLNRVREFEAWQAHVLPTKNFIQTKAKPRIFYVPKTYTSKTEKLLALSKISIEEAIARRATSLQEEIENSEKKARKGYLDAAEDHEGNDEQGDENRRPEDDEEEEDDHQFPVKEGKFDAEDLPLTPNDTGKSNDQWVEKETQSDDETSERQNFLPDTGNVGMNESPEGVTEQQSEAADKSVDEDEESGKENKLEDEPDNELITEQTNEQHVDDSKSEKSDDESENPMQIPVPPSTEEIPLPVGTRNRWDQKETVKDPERAEREDSNKDDSTEDEKGKEKPSGVKNIRKVKIGDDDSESSEDESKKLKSKKALKTSRKTSAEKEKPTAKETLKSKEKSVRERSRDPKSPRRSRDRRRDSKASRKSPVRRSRSKRSRSTTRRRDSRRSPRRRRSRSHQRSPVRRNRGRKSRSTSRRRRRDRKQSSKANSSSSPSPRRNRKKSNSDSD